MKRESGEAAETLGEVFEKELPVNVMALKIYGKCLI